MNQLKIIKETEILEKQFKIYGDTEDPLFLAKDVAEWIEHSQPSVMLKNVDEEEKVMNTIHTLGGKQESWFLTEDGVYEVLMQSRKPIAKQFKKQVKKILKDIRLYGMYEVPATYADALQLAVDQQRLLEVQNQQITIQYQVIGEMQPKVDYVDKILKTKQLMNITQIAKDYGMSGLAMNKLLHEYGVQYKQNDQWLLYSKHQRKGYTKSDTTIVKNSSGEDIAVLHTKWTQKGRMFLYELLRDKGFLPLMEDEQ